MYHQASYPATVLVLIETFILYTFRLSYAKKVSLCSDYKKGTATLFRLLYTKEETEGRTLKGHKSNSKRPARPGLEDLTKIQVIYGKLILFYCLLNITTN